MSIAEYTQNSFKNMVAILDLAEGKMCAGTYMAWARGWSWLM